MNVKKWALIAVAVTSTALIGFAAWLIYLLAIPDWCGRAIGATKSADARAEYAVGGCFNLLNKQVSALSINSFIALGTLALCLAVLTVIVLADARLNLKASRSGVEADVGRNPVEAARTVADAADSKASEIADAAPEAHRRS
jgi:hypothetical protein